MGQHLSAVPVRRGGRHHLRSDSGPASNFRTCNSEFLNLPPKNSRGSRQACESYTVLFINHSVKTNPSSSIQLEDRL